MQGPETDYAFGEAICREMFALVMKAHRVTVEQMAILEPALSETIVATCMVVIKEAIDEAVRRGVPAEAARDFILGQINIDIGILFGYVGSPFFDGALLAIERGKKYLLQPDWKKVFEPENVLGEIKAITAGKVRAYLDLCLALGVRPLRIVVDDAGHQPSCKAIVATLRAVVPDLTCAGLALAIENHERFRAHTLSRMVQELDHPSIGICFDTVNSFGALEGPEHVIEKLGPAVVNLHVKDFVIAREPHQMGFRITGAPAGHGMLDIPGLLAKLDALKARGNAILELWPPPEATTEETIAKEKRWREQSVEYLRTLIAN
jgi:sugar phosphate isomerase/epimerase